MADGQGFDVRKAIEQSSSKSTLQELAKKGIHRVKVLDEQMINKLIGDAVERIISTKTNLLSTDDREKLIAASRKELDRLMGEFKETKDKNELMEKDKGSLASEIENLQNQIKTHRKLADDTAKQRYEDGKAVMRAEVDDMKKKMSSMEEEITRRVRREVELEYQAKSAGSQAQIEQMKGDVARRESELRDQFERREKELREELPGRVRKELELEFQAKAANHQLQIAQAQSQAEQLKAESSRRESEFRDQMERRERDLREELGRREQDIVARGASMKEAELRTKLDDMQSKNMEMASKHAEALEEIKKSDDKVLSTLSDLFNKALEGVKKQLTDLKLRSLAGGGVGGGGGMVRMEGDLEFRPSQSTLENLVASELESNLKSMQVEAKTSGKISSALDRLKAMRGGGETKKEEKK